MPVPENSVYFGNLRKAQWVKAPMVGIGASSVGVVDQMDYANGGAFVSQSAGAHREFDMSWPTGGEEDFRFLREYREGDCGSGLLYWVDPMAMDVNALPPHVARPELSGKGWPSILGSGMEPVIAPATQTFTNLATNPSFESVAPGATVVRTNAATNSRAALDADWVVNPGTGGAATRAYSPAGGPDGAPFVTGAWSVAPTGGNPRIALDKSTPVGSVAEGAAHTVSCWVKSPATLAVAVGVDWNTSAGAYITLSSSAPVTLVPNVWTRISVTAVTPATTSRAFPYVWFSGGVVAGIALSVTGVLVEQTDQLRPYFDGSTPDALGFDYGWTGAANASTSTAKASTLEVRRNLITNPSFAVDTAGWGFNGFCSRSLTGGTLGRPAMVLSRNAGTVPILGLSPRFAVTAGETVRASALLAGAAGQTIQIDFEFYTVSTGGTLLAGTPRGSATTTGSPLRWGTPATVVPAGATWAEVRIFRDSGAVDGDVFVTDVLAEKSPNLDSYFDGSTPALGDFTNAWTGTVNASASIQRGVSVAVATLNASGGGLVGAAIYRSASSDGSIRLALRKGAGYAYANAVGTTITGLSPSTAYTFSIEASSASATVVNIIDRGPAGANYSPQQKSLTPTPTRISRTFTTGPGETTRMVDVGLEGTDASFGTVVILEDAMLTAATYLGPYFDGSVIFRSGDPVVWNGVAHASTSTLTTEYTNMPDSTATYTLSSPVDTIPQRKTVLIIPPEHTLWLGYTGAASAGGVVRVQPVYREGGYAPVQDLTLLDAAGTTRLNTSFDGATYGAVLIYLTQTISGSATVTLNSAKAVYSLTGITPSLIGGHVKGVGHSGLRFSAGPTFAYVYYNEDAGKKYVSAAAKFTEVGSWV